MSSLNLIPPTELLDKKKKKINLYDAIKASYGSKEHENNIINNGYIKDNSLSNHNQSVYYHPKKQKLLAGVAGTHFTHNLNDVGVDVMHAIGVIKSTNRFKEAEDVLKKSKEKYNPRKTDIVGHSIGGTITNYLGDSKDRKHTLDAGYTIGQPTRPDENNYRTAYDPVSLLASGAKHIKTLRNNHDGLFNKIVHAHDVDNIKDSNIYI